VAAAEDLRLTNVVTGSPVSSGMAVEPIGTMPGEWFDGAVRDGVAPGRYAGAYSALRKGGNMPIEAVVQDYHTAIDNMRKSFPKPGEGQEASEVLVGEARNRMLPLS
jgi:hypothetical protein